MIFSIEKKANVPCFSELQFTVCLREKFTSNLATDCRLNIINLNLLMHNDKLID